jgi:hypothetical protein
MPPPQQILSAAWPHLRAALAALLGLLAALASAAPAEPPPRLSDTGLFGPGVTAFAPLYVLWSDNAAKRRWIALPLGKAIDARDPDAWSFPRGTRLWKEFAVDGRPVETRFIERRADGSWSFASYVWNAEGTEALLAPARGSTLAVAGAPGGRYTVPGRGDCLACHGGAPVPVLGYSALQLAPELPALVARGQLHGLPAALLKQPPRIAATTPTERAALGLLHANCGHCHHGRGGVPVALRLAQRVADAEASRAEVLASLLETGGRVNAGAPLIEPGQPRQSVLVQRMRSRQGLLQMPPLGTQRPDDEGLALVERWITHDLTPRKEP